MATSILYVEDEANDVILLRHAARKAGLQHAVQVVETGKLAMDYLEGRGPFADRGEYPLPSLVLLDLNLPVCSGFEVLRWIRQQPQFASLPVVVFSGSGVESDMARARELGASGYEVKPVLDELPALLLRLQDRWLTPR